MKNIKVFRSDGTYIKIEENVSNKEIVGICFSGIYYSFHCPLLYYSRNILFEYSIDYIAVDYLYAENDVFSQLDDQDKIKYIEQDKILVSNYLINKIKLFKKIIMIGKSLGVHFIRFLMQNDEIRNKSTMVLFTPGNEWNDMILELITWEQKALIIGSRKDTLFNVQNLNKLNNARHCQVVEIPDADHSLEVDNITLDLANLSFIMSKVKAFIDGFTNKN